MEYGAFSDASLKMMYEAVRGALQADADRFAGGEIALDNLPKNRPRAFVELREPRGRCDQAGKFVAGHRRLLTTRRIVHTPCRFKNVMRRPRRKPGVLARSAALFRNAVSTFPTTAAKSTANSLTPSLFGGFHAAKPPCA